MVLTGVFICLGLDPTESRLAADDFFTFCLIVARPGGDKFLTPVRLASGLLLKEPVDPFLPAELAIDARLGL